MIKRQTFSVSFLCRGSKMDKNGYSPIELSLVINGERTYLKLQRKERPEVWKKAIDAKRDNEIKAFRENQTIRIRKIMDDMELVGMELTASNLKECIKRGGVVIGYTLGKLWADLVDNKRSQMRIGEIQEDTYRRYYVSKCAFYEANGFTDNTPADIVELQHINKLQSYIRETLKEAQCTAYNYHARVKSAFTLAFQRGKIHANPYAGFKMSKGEKKEIVFLSEKEVSAIAKKQFEGRLAKVRDLFLFQCYSGLSYADMASLETNDFKVEGNAIMIRKPRKKTGVVFTSIVLPEGVKILERYNYKLPILSNEKANAYLKEIQTICNIDKKLHTHLGRTTYISFLYNKGIKPEIIAEVVGHTTARTTLRYYAKMQNDTIISAFQNKSLIANTSSTTSV